MEISDISDFRKIFSDYFSSYFAFLEVAYVFKNFRVDNSEPLNSFFRKSKEIRESLELAEQYFLETLQNNSDFENMCNTLGITLNSDLEDTE